MTGHQRQLVHHQKSPVWDLTRLGADVDGAPEVEWFGELTSNGPETLHLVLLHREGVGLDAVLGEPYSTSARVSSGTNQGISGRRRGGRGPRQWSSWPWVRTMATTSSDGQQCS